MPKPIADTFPPYFKNYIDLVAEDNLRDVFRNQQAVVNNFFISIPEAKTIKPYTPGKWTLKELLQHLIDTERIFNYRALAFARKEKQSLPGFDENEYAVNSNANARKWKDLCEEFIIVRRSTEILFDSFSDDVLHLSGLANNKSMNVLALGYVIAGHIEHHKKIVEERYL
jgi:hypothetical protein